MTAPMLNLAEIASVVENGGLEYAIRFYMSSDNVQDERLAKLWRKADDVLFEIMEILTPYFEQE